MKLAIALFMVMAQGTITGCVSGIPEDNPATMIPFVHKADTPGGMVSKDSMVDDQTTYSRRLIIKNDSKFVVFNDEWYVPDCWENVRWYQNGRELAPGGEPVLLPGKEAEVRTDYLPCTENPNEYFFFTTNKAAVDTCAFVLTGHAAGHHTQLHVVAYGKPVQHTSCGCRDNGHCHFQDVLAGNTKVPESVKLHD